MCIDPGKWFIFAQLSLDLVESWLERNPEATEFTNGGTTFRDIALFQDYHGLPAFKNVMIIFDSVDKGCRIKKTAF